MRIRRARILLWILITLSLSAKLDTSSISLDDRKSANPGGLAANLNPFTVRYSDSSSERLPNESDLVIPQDEDKAFLEEILGTVLKNKTNPSDEEKCIQILKYISSSFVDQPNDGSATKMIRDGFALCGGKSHSFAILCRKAGMPARYVGSMYMSTMSSHAISEVFYEGRWHLYDATFGMFFYSRSDYDKAGRVISFHELVSNPEVGTAFKVVPKAGAGKYDDSIKAFPITRVGSEQTKRGKKEVKLLSRYRKEINEAYPIAYGSDDLVSYPVDANLLQVKNQWFGKVNDSNEELARYEARFAGSHYVGNAAPPAFHTWLVKASPLTAVNIEYHSVYPNPPKLRLVPLRGAKVIGCKYEDKKVTFTVYVNDSEAILSIYSPDDTFHVDAMHIYR